MNNFPMTLRRVILVLSALHSLAAVATAADAPAAIEILRPRGGEKWSVGSYHAIQWNSNLRHPLRPEYSTDAGRSWIDVEAAAPVGGRLVWRVPETLSARCRVRVTDPRDGASAVSGKDFAIVPSQQRAGYAWVQA